MTWNMTKLRATNGWGLGLVVIPGCEIALYLGKRILCWKKIQS